jgi:hypothetical protein
VSGQNFNFKVNEEVIFKTNLEGTEIFIVFLNEDNHYFKINGLAAKIWKIIDEKGNEKINSESLFEECNQKLNPNNEKFQNDFHQFLNQLKEEKIIHPE